jgi:hypothetical protein
MHNASIVAAALVLALQTHVMSQDNSSDGKGSASVIGRWDITVHGADGDYPSWFEIRRSGYRTLVGSYVGQFGSARPIGKVEFENGRFLFTVPPQFEQRRDDIVIEGKVDGDKLHGELNDGGGKAIEWDGRRAPSLKRDAPAKWKPATDLFNGRDLAGWKPRAASKKNGWQVRDGVLVNAEPGNDLVSERKFNDFKLHAEFRYPRGSNSGLYLRGRYEVQIEDNYGQEIDDHKIGSVYGFLTPAVNAAEPAGEWQSVDITLVGRKITVVLNGERIIDRQTIPGITGGALDSNEGEPGPFFLQGDHDGGMAYRNIRVQLPR